MDLIWSTVYSSRVHSIICWKFKRKHNKNNKYFFRMKNVLTRAETIVIHQSIIFKFDDVHIEMLKIHWTNFIFFWHADHITMQKYTLLLYKLRHFHFWSNSLLSRNSFFSFPFFFFFISLVFFFFFASLFIGSRAKRNSKIY